MITTPETVSKTTPLIDFRRLYSQAAITMCWRLTRHKIAGDAGMENHRQLIFASVELIPEYMKVFQESPGSVLDAEQQATFTGARVFFIRFVVSAPEGINWYEQSLRNGFIQMFWDNSKPVEFHPYHNDNIRLLSFPHYPETAYLQDSPIIPRCWNHAQVSHYMPVDPLDELTEFVSHQNVADWIDERLCWRLENNIEFLGSICLVAPNPYYHRSHCRLNPDPSRKGPDRVEFRVDRAPSHFLNPLTVVLAERFNGNEFGVIQQHQLTNGEQLDFTLRGRANETGYAVIDDNGIIWDMQDFAPFIRSFSIEMGVIDKELVYNCKDGKEQRIAKYGEKRDITINESDKETKTTALSSKIVAIRRRNRRSITQFVYYRQEGEAERKIRELIHSARRSLFIADPYYSPQTAKLFLEATRSTDVKTTILCTVGGLKKCKDGSDPGRELLAIVKEAAGKNLQGPINVKVCPQDMLHDRFIVIDESEAWLLGSSLNTLGDSLSVIVRLDNPQATIIPVLDKIVRDNQTRRLDEWITLQKESRKTSNQSDSDC